MAGSYKHVTDENYDFIGQEFYDMHDDMGDAYESCEEMVWMIKYLSGNDPKKIEEAIEAFYNKDKK